jgi:hypothetical protein
MSRQLLGYDTALRRWEATVDGMLAARGIVVPANVANTETF